VSDVNDKFKDELIGRTRQVWQPRLARDLSREDARQIAETVAGFFALLAEWSRVDTAVTGEQCRQASRLPERGGAQ
jgi:hypothetical protein